jgi:preprotein translocase subunit Sss1
MLLTINTMDSQELIKDEMKEIKQTLKDFIAECQDKYQTKETCSVITCAQDDRYEKLYKLTLGALGVAIMEVIGLLISIIWFLLNRIN